MGRVVAEWGGGKIGGGGKQMVDCYPGGERM